MSNLKTVKRQIVMVWEHISYDAYQLLEPGETEMSVSDKAELTLVAGRVTF